MYNTNLPSKDCEREVLYFSLKCNDALVVASCHFFVLIGLYPKREPFSEILEGGRSKLETQATLGVLKIVSTSNRGASVRTSLAASAIIGS